MVHENVEHMRQILVNHHRKLDTMANGMETIQVCFILFYIRSKIECKIFTAPNEVGAR